MSIYKSRGSILRRLMDSQYLHEGIWKKYNSMICVASLNNWTGCSFHLAHSCCLSTSYPQLHLQEEQNLKRPQNTSKRQKFWEKFWFELPRLSQRCAMVATTSLICQHFLHCHSYSYRRYIQAWQRTSRTSRSYLAGVQHEQGLGDTHMRFGRENG